MFRIKFMGLTLVGDLEFKFVVCKSTVKFLLCKDLPFLKKVHTMPSSILQLVNAHRIFLYSAFSFVSVCAVVTNALKNYSNFYSVAIHLSKSSRSVLVSSKHVYSTQLTYREGSRQFWYSFKPPSWPCCPANIFWCSET